MNINRRVIQLFLVMGVCLSLSCSSDESAPYAITNFTSEPIAANIPIILSIEVDGDGHLVTIRAQNEEIVFSGYRLYTGASEAEARQQLTGSDCSYFSQAEGVDHVEYVIEVRPGISEVSSSSYLCFVSQALIPGEWVVLRALAFQNILEVTPGEPSNAVLVP